MQRVRHSLRATFVVALWIAVALSVFAGGRLHAQDVYAPYEPGNVERSGIGARRTDAAKGPVSEPAVFDAIQELKGRYGDDAEVEFLPGPERTVMVRGLGRGGASPSVAASASDANRGRIVAEALAFLTRERVLFGTPAGEQELAVDDVHELGDLAIVRIREEYQGATVLGAGASVFLDAAGRISGAITRFADGVHPRNHRRIDEASAARAVHARIAGGRALAISAPTRIRLAVLRRQRTDRFVYDISTHVGSIPYRALVDAESGEVIGYSSLLRSADCSPVPRGDAFAESPAYGPQSRLVFSDLDCSETFLNGEFVRSFRWVDTDPFTWFPIFTFGLRGSVTEGGVVFAANGSRDLSQTTIYHHATEFHSWLRDLGFTRLERPFPTVANAEECFGFFPCENAYYDPVFPYSTGAGILVFGTGFSINFGLEADVICHEYTHAVVHETTGLGEDFFDPRLFYSLALNEAFADWFSCTYLGDPALGEYSGAAFGRTPLRTLDNDLRWPDDIDPEYYHDTGQIWGGALWDIRDAFSRGGEDPNDIRTAERLAYSALLSLPSNADFLLAAGALITASQALGLSEAQKVTVRDVLADRGLTFRSGEPPATIDHLGYDETADGDIAAAIGGGLRLGTVQYELEIGEEGARLEVEVAGDADVDLYLRYNAPVVISQDRVLATFSAESAASTETIEVTRDSVPALAPGSWFVAIVNRSSAIVSYTVRATLEVDQVETVIDLSPGREATGAIGGGPALAREQYRLDVSNVAGQRLVATLTAPTDVDLFARRDAPVELGPEGQIVADVSVRSTSGNERLEIDRSTVPALEPGSWFFAVRNAQPSPVEFALEAELTQVNLPANRQIALVPEAGVAGTVDGTTVGTARLAPEQYTVAVPNDGTRLRVTVVSRGEIGIYARRGARVLVENGRLSYDHASNVPGPGDESVVIDLLSTPELEPGTYFFAVANRGAESTSFTITAELTSEAAAPSVVNLPSGQWQTITVARARAGETLSRTQYSLVLNGRETGLDVLTNPLGAGNFDMYVRRDRPVQVLDGAVVADWRSENPSGAESVTIFEDELSAGTYYLAFVNRTTRDIRTDVLAVYDAGLPLSANVTPDDLFTGTISAAPNPPTGCRLTLDQFVVRVPANALRLEMSVVPLTSGPLQVLRRFGSRILIDLGNAIFDEDHSTIDGALVIDGLELQPGLYYFAVVNCQGREERYELSIEMPLSGSTQQDLDNGSFSAGFAEAATGASGRLATTQYRFTVPAGFDEVTFGAWGGTCADRDVDRFIAHGERVTWNVTGATNALWKSERAGPGVESLLISPSSNPPLRPGTYWAAIVNRTRESVPVRVGVSAWPGETVSIQSGVSSRDTVRAAGGGGGVLLLRQFRIDVAPGADRVDADLRPVGNTNLDIDLHGRFGIPMVIENGTLITDVSSETLTGLESVSFPLGRDCLRPGPYYFAVANFAPSQVTFDLSVTVSGDTCVPVEPGDRIANEATGGGAIAAQHCIEVARGASGFQVDLIATDGDDVDLYIRRNAPVARQGNSVVADLRADSTSPLEWLALPESRISEGRYFIATVAKTAASAPYELAVRDLDESERSLALGEPAEAVALGSSADGIVWLSSEQFALDLAPGTPALEVELESATSGARLDLYARRGVRVLPDGNTIAADSSLTGNASTKTLRIDSPAGGLWYFAVANRRTRAEPFLLRASTGGSQIRIIRGDADEDGALTLSDAIIVLSHLFISPRDICETAGDSDGSGSLSLTDPIIVLQHLFLGGAPPVDPYPDCGAVEDPGPGCDGSACP